MIMLTKPVIFNGEFYLAGQNYNNPELEAFVKASGNKNVASDPTKAAKAADKATDKAAKAQAAITATEVNAGNETQENFELAQEEEKAQV